MQRNITKTTDRITVRSFFEKHAKTLELELVAGERGLDRHIGEKSINRPALAMVGYYKYFAAKRLQLFGAGEMAYLRDQQPEEQARIVDEMLQRNIPCIVISRGLAPTRPLREVCESHGVPLFRTSHKSKDFSAEATLLLDEMFAPTTTLHGTLMDIKGVGCLLRGKSGVGKSECALALVERGHSLVADDLTRVRKVGDQEVIGTSDPLNRGYMECRGIGIIDVSKIFGVRSVRLDKRIDLILTFVLWEPGMMEERTGLDHQYLDVLDIPVEHMELPVRPGRDMARLVEVAALVRALKVMGHDSAQEFNERLIQQMADS